MTEVTIERVKQILIFAAAVYNVLQENPRWYETAMHADVWNTNEDPNMLRGTIEIKTLPIPGVPQRWPLDGMTVDVEGRAGEHLMSIENSVSLLMTSGIDGGFLNRAIKGFRSYKHGGPKHNCYRDTPICIILEKTKNFPRAKIKNF